MNQTGARLFFAAEFGCQDLSGGWTCARYPGRPPWAPDMARFALKGDGDAGREGPTRTYKYLSPTFVVGPLELVREFYTALDQMCIERNE